jgi:hypothetical protein
MTINISMNHERYVTGLTLVDITSTGVIHNRADREFERNQQRNWETVLQCIGLRTQPFDILEPVVKSMNVDDHFGEMYYGKQRVWCFTFTVEQLGVWDNGQDALALLHKDFDEVPVIQGLSESARFILPIFYTQGAIKNIFFRFGRLDLNSI